MQSLLRLTCDFDQAKIWIAIKEDTKPDPSKHPNTTLFIHSQYVKLQLLCLILSVMKMLIEQHQVEQKTKYNVIKC